EIVRRNLGLAQNAVQRAKLHLTVHRHDGAGAALAQNGVAAAVANEFEAELLKGFHNLCAGQDRQLRHLRGRSEEHTSELQSRENLVCRLLPEKKLEVQAASVDLPIGPFVTRNALRSE